MLAGHDDGTLGDPGGQSLGHPGDLGARTLRGPSAPTPGTTGPGTLAGPRLRGHGKRSPGLYLALALALDLGLGLRLGRTPPAPPGRYGALRLGPGIALVRRPRDPALQERVDGRPARTPPPAPGSRLPKGHGVPRAHGTGRVGPGVRRGGGG
ncbi:hypothetical protein ABZW13_38945, partial [Streptomyces sp. NPDC005549]